MLVDFESDWFKSYCRAVLENEPAIARAEIQNAIELIHGRLLVNDLTREEREAMQAAVRYLELMDDDGFPKAS